ncbi:MAG: beta-lactamase family protein [Rubrivivax sp.]|nr:beta-lactamase family protein [Rubrivivax sp.]
MAVAKLRQGQLVDRLPEDSCGASADSSAVFQAASLAKPVVATLALKFVLRGQLDLERPLSELLPEGYVHRQNLFALREPPVVDVVPSEVLEQLTTRHLLSHTSGLPNWSDRAPLRLAAKPGTRWRYSGEGYVLLQHLLQTMTGMPLNALASAELFEPLRLRDTAFKLTDRIAASLVPGRSASGQIRQLRFPYEIAASSLYTSAPDYARFMAATLDDPRLLNLITDAPVPVPGAPAVHWGLGWAIEQSTDHRAIWHWGRNPGFRALAMADLASKDAVVVLAATEGGMPLAKSAVRQVLPGSHPGLDLHLVQ